MVMVIEGICMRVVCWELVFMCDWMSFGSIIAFIIREKFKRWAKNSGVHDPFGEA